MRNVVFLLLFDDSAPSVKILKNPNLVKLRVARHIEVKVDQINTFNPRYFYFPRHPIKPRPLLDIVHNPEYLRYFIQDLFAVQAKERIAKCSWQMSFVRRRLILSKCLRFIILSVGWQHLSLVFQLFYDRALRVIELERKIEISEIF